MIDIAKLEKQAGRYRREWNIEDAGFVVFTAGQWSDDLEAEGWLRNLDRPAAFVPDRSFALAADGVLWVARGGNEYDGAHSWVPYLQE